MAQESLQAGREGQPVSDETMEIAAAVSGEPQKEGLHPDFLRPDDDERVIKFWSLVQAYGEMPLGATAHRLIYDEALIKIWRDKTAKRITYSGKAMHAKLIKFEVTEATPPDPTKFRLWIGVEVTGPIDPP